MLPTAEPATVAAAPRETLRARLAARLPEIIIESTFVLIAVVLAFAVEEWREERELDKIAQEARRAIVAEVQHNRDELLESRPGIEASVDSLDAALSTVAADPASLRGLDVKFELALLSSAAWRSAQSMEAARRMDYAWMLQVARAYELQTMYEQAQWAAVEANLAFRVAADDAARVAAARTLHARIASLARFGQSVEGDYIPLLPATPPKGAAP